MLQLLYNLYVYPMNHHWFNSHNNFSGKGPLINSDYFKHVTLTALTINLIVLSFIFFLAYELISNRQSFNNNDSAEDLTSRWGFDYFIATLLALFSYFAYLNTFARLLYERNFNLILLVISIVIAIIAQPNHTVDRPKWVRNLDAMLNIICYGSMVINGILLFLTNIVQMIAFIVFGTIIGCLITIIYEIRDDDVEEIDNQPKPICLDHKDGRD